MEEVAVGFLAVGLKRAGASGPFVVPYNVYCSRNETKVEPCEGDSGAGILDGEELLGPVGLSS